MFFSLSYRIIASKKHQNCIISASFIDIFFREIYDMVKKRRKDP